MLPYFDRKKIRIIICYVIARKHKNSLPDGDVKSDKGVIGVIGELSSSTDSEAELVRPDIFVVCDLSSLLLATPRDSVRLVGAMVTAGLLFSLFSLAASKNEPVNEPHKLLADVAVATVDNIGLLTDVFTAFKLSLRSDVDGESGEFFSLVFTLNDDVELDDFTLAVPSFSTSSFISSALSIVFCASFNAVFAILANPVASNQLIFA